MDSALKDILREEKRRHNEHGKSSKNHNNKHKKSGKETSHRRHKSENESKSIEFVKTESHQKQDERIILMFLYEDNDGNLYRKLENISKKEGVEAKIFPVYVHGSHDNFTEEEIVFKNGKWTSTVENSWLECINKPEYNHLTFDGDDVVVYNNKLFHCEGDMLEYIRDFGPEILKVK